MANQSRPASASSNARASPSSAIRRAGVEPLRWRDATAPAGFLRSGAFKHLMPASGGHAFPLPNRGAGAEPPL